MTSSAQVVTLTDSTGTATADILVSQGFNCFRLTLATQEESFDWLWATEPFARGEERASRCGIPILFPFPGRIGGGQFQWEGHDYRLETNDGQGNAIHGFVHTRPWTIVEQKMDQLIGEISSETFTNEEAALWPAHFRLRADYQLMSDRLITKYTVENPTHQALPFGLGLHPYFRLPVDPQQRDAVTVQVPVKRQWNLEHLLPTGESQTLAHDHPLRLGQSFSSMNYDDVFSEPDVQNRHVTSIVVDRANNRRLMIEAGPEFDAYVLYTPPHREAVCIEPYTTLPDPFRMHQRGLAPALRVLEGHQREAFEVVYRAATITG